MRVKLEQFQLDGNRPVPRAPPLAACEERSRAKRAGEGHCPRTRPSPQPSQPKSDISDFGRFNSDRTRVNPRSVAGGEREHTETAASYLMALTWLKIASAPISLA